jgi:propanol-preferring alcohol dehydrogenase
MHLSNSQRNESRFVKMAAAATQQTFDIPKKYKACVYDKPGTISTKIEELDTPEPGPGDVLVRL